MGASQTWHVGGTMYFIETQAANGQVLPEVIILQCAGQAV
jgi:hypothetical protein